MWGRLPRRSDHYLLQGKRTVRPYPKETPHLIWRRVPHGKDSRNPLWRCAHALDPTGELNWYRPLLAHIDAESCILEERQPFASAVVANVRWIAQNFDSLKMSVEQWRLSSHGV